MGQHGIEEAKAAYARICLIQNPDIERLQIEDMIAEGDKVATRWTTYEKGKATSTGITINRVVGGKITDDWFGSREIEE
jgi:predicted ester cyclase